MKLQKALGCVLYAATVFGVSAQKADSLAYQKNLYEAVVASNRAIKSTPVAFTNISKKDLQELNYGQDIPFILSNTPSVISTSDAGTGIGYTSIRVRGTDGTRINVTSNGIPLNDGESATLYWVDLPDFASSVQEIQLQRGVGTSTNGFGAFGGSINIRTEDFSALPYASFDASYGSFNTNKETIKFGTGTIARNWNFEGRLSHIASDGYRDRASTSMNSYYAALSYADGPTIIKFITFGGKEITYHAWDGISRSDLESNRRYNPNGEILDATGKVVGFYDNQYDCFQQNHYQTHIDHKFSKKLSLNAALHYTYGTGYYEEYKNNKKLTSYGLLPFTHDGITVSKTDIIRQKNNKGHFMGGLFNMKYKERNLLLFFGGSFNYFTNDHYGYVLWAKNYLGDLKPQHKYYDNTGRKGDAAAYVRAEYQPLSILNIYADLQYRHVHYVIEGINDDAFNDFDLHETFHFLNPKVGITLQPNNKNKVYASFAIANKEPVRNNYSDGYLPGMPMPKSERLYDLEAGYQYHDTRFHAGANFYLMNYHNQLVSTGKLNSIGEPIVENVKSSYRMGLELEGGWQVFPCLAWDVNATLSRNRIKDYSAYLYDYNGSWATTDPIYIGNTPIGYSPDFIFNNILKFRYHRFSALATTQYVSRQYLDNLGTRESSLSDYCVTNLTLNYSINVKGLKECTIGASIYNLFDAKYCNNGYSQTTYQKTSGSIEYIHDPRFYPMAGINFLAHVHLKF